MLEPECSSYRYVFPTEEPFPTLLYIDGFRPLVGTAVDLSLSGMHLEVELPSFLSMDKPVSVGLTLPGSGGLVSIRATITHQRQPRDGVLLCGLKFLTLPEQASQKKLEADLWRFLLTQQRRAAMVARQPERGREARPAKIGCVD